MMLTVQMMRGSVGIDRTNGSSQSKYHGNTAGAQRSAAAIGQANASADHVWDLLLKQIAIRMPTKTASPATSCGGATVRNISKTGSLNPNPWMYAPSEPVGIRPWVRNGTYRSANTIAASTASRTRTRRQ